MACPHSRYKKLHYSILLPSLSFAFFPDSKAPLSLISGSRERCGCQANAWRLSGRTPEQVLTQPGRQRWLLIEVLCCSESSLPCMTYPSLVRRLVGEGHSCLQELKTVLISGIFLWCKLSEITRQSWGYWGMHHKMLLGKPALLFRPTWQVWKLKIRTSSIFGIIQQTRDLLVWESEVSQLIWRLLT